MQKVSGIAVLFFLSVFSWMGFADNTPPAQTYYQQVDALFAKGTAPKISDFNSNQYWTGSFVKAESPGTLFDSVFQLLIKTDPLFGDRIYGAPSAEGDLEDLIDSRQLGNYRASSSNSLFAVLPSKDTEDLFWPSKGYELRFAQGNRSQVLICRIYCAQDQPLPEDIANAGSTACSFGPLNTTFGYAYYFEKDKKPNSEPTPK